GDAGWPYATPSSSSTESQPRTMPWLSVAATAAAFASARARQSRSGVSAVIAVSSTPLTMTLGSSPAPRNTLRRAGEAEASTNSVTIGQPSLLLVWVPVDQAPEPIFLA